jgi:hypothetical protein
MKKIGKAGTSAPKVRGTKMGDGPHKYGESKGKQSSTKGSKGSKGFGLGVGPRYMHQARAASSKMHKANSVGAD